MTCILSVAVCRIVLMLCAMGARVYTRVVVLKEWSTEDCKCYLLQSEGHFAVLIVS
jgi:hypothetical protein